MMKRDMSRIREEKAHTQAMLSSKRNEMQRIKTQESNKVVGNGKRVSARKAMDSYGSEARTQGSGTTYLYPANIGEMGHGSEVKEGVV